MFKYSFAVLLSAACVFAQPKVTPEKEAAMKADLNGQIDAMKKQAQVMVDSVFSFGELGFPGVRDFEVSDRNPRKGRLQDRAGVAGIPTAWVASWGEGKPVSRSAPISMTSRRPRRSPAWRITIR